MEKLRGELWEGRAVDGKLKSSLEWPNGRKLCPVCRGVLGCYPARACASKGLCDRSWCLLYIIYLFIYCYISARTFFYLSKYSLSDTHFSTGRLLFEFNRLQYTLAAPEVFASSANPVILPSGYRVSIVRNTNIDQIETTPLRYCIRLNTPTPGTASYMYTA